MIKHIRPGPRLSGAVVHNGIVYVSGQVPDTPYAEMNKPWEEWVAPGPAPARATVEARIANPRFRVEIAVVAAVH